MTLFESQLVVSLAPGTIASGASATLDAVKVPAATVTISGGTTIGTATGFNLASIAGPVLNGALTIAAAATLAILGPPTGTATVTAPYALWVEAGTTYLAGAVQIQSLTGMLKATTGIVSAATPGSDYQQPLSAADGTIIFPTANTVRVGTVPGNHISGFTSGSVIFADSGGALAENNAAFYWNNSTGRLGLNGNSSPAAPLHIVSDGGTARAMRFHTSGNSADYMEFITGGVETRMDVALAKQFRLTTNAGADHLTITAVGNLIFDSTGTSGNSRFRTGGVQIDSFAANGYVFNTNAGPLTIAAEAGLSVVGRAAGSTGPVAAITGVTDGHVLRILSGTLGFGTISGASVGGFTTGSVVFAGSSGTLTEDNANLFWNDTTNRLGIGTTSPQAPLHVVTDSITARALRYHVLGDTTDYLDFIIGGAVARMDIAKAKKFSITQNGAGTDRFIITAGGDIQFTPAALFQVTAGAMRTDGLGSTGLIKNNNGANWTIATAGVDFENALTFSQGVTRAANAVTGDYITGKTGAQTWTGSTDVSGALTIRSSSNATKGTLTLSASNISIPGDIVSPSNPIRLQIGAGLTVIYIDNAQHVGIGGVAPGASQVLDVALTESVASGTSATLDAFLVRGSTITVTGGTAITTAAGFNYVSFAGPTYSGTAAVTTAATVTILGAPTGSGLTITNRLAFWVQADQARFDGAVRIQSLNGLLKATTGVVSAATAGTDFENPLTFSQGVTRSGNAITGDYITGVAASSNTWTASTTNGGTLTLRTSTGTRGALTLDSSVVNVPGDIISGSNPLRLQTGAGVTAIYVDANQNVGIGGVAPGATSDLDISAAPTIASGAGAVWDGVLVRASTATLTGGTTVSTSTGFNLVAFKAPTINGGLTVTNAATLAISGAPSGSATITNKYSLWSQGGTVRFDGAVLQIGGDIVSPSADMRLQTGASVTAGYFDGSQRVGLGGVAPGANNRLRIGAALPSIALGGSTALNYIQIDGTTVTFTGAGVTDSLAAGVNYVSIGQPTYSDASGATINNSSTFAIVGPPLGSSITLLNNYAFWVQAGGTRLDGTVLVQQDIVTTSGGVMRLQTGAGVTGVYIDGSQRIGLGGVAPNVGNRLRVGGAIPAVASATNATLDWALFDGTTVNISGGTSITTAAGFNYMTIKAPTYSGTAFVQRAATLAIEGPPNTSGLALGFPFALWVQNGLGNFSGTTGTNQDNTPIQARQVFRTPIFQSTQINPYVSERGTLWIPIAIDGPLSSSNVFGGVETSTVGYIPVLVHD
jgi:hypothetical protein